MRWRTRTTYETPYDASYLDVVSANMSETHWSVMVTINGQEMCFKLDTGAEVTVISNHTWELLKENELQSSNKRLYGPDNNPLELVGQLPVTIEYKGRSCVHTAPPFALFTPRRVSIPLRKEVAEQLARMESLGVILCVDQPTSWCAGMVVIPKKSELFVSVWTSGGSMSVLHETHALLKVDHTLAQLAGATVFSKIDANSGFCQIPLKESSRELTTFITPFGRYQFHQMPFGITSASKSRNCRALQQQVLSLY